MKSFFFRYQALTNFTILLLAAIWIGITAVFFQNSTNGFIPAPQEGFLAPDFTLETNTGEIIALSNLQGKAVLINFWASWCPPCREEMPSMQRLYQEIDDDRFEILAISVDAPFGETDPFGRVGGDLLAYGDSLGITFSLLHDPSGRVQQTFQTTGVPESFVIDEKGVVIKKISGSTQWDAPQNVDLIRRLLGG